MRAWVTRGLDIFGSVDWTVTLGVDSTGFYLQPGDVTVSAYVEGGVSISLQAGMFSLHTGAFTGTGPTASVSFSDPNGDGKLRTSEFASTVISASYDTTNYSISIPVNFDDASMALAEDASLIFSRTNSVDSAFDLTSGANLPTLLRTVSLNPQMIVDSLYRLQLSMQSLNAAEALRFTLPLTQGMMPRDVIDFADGIADGLNDALLNLVEIPIDGGGTTTEVQPAFSTWTQLQSALAVLTSALDFDPATREIVFSLDYEYDFPSVDIPLDFSVDFSPLSLLSDSTISLTGSASYGFDLGMQLAPNEQLMIVASQASVDSDDPETVSNCYNPGFLQFDIAVNLDAAKTFTVSLSPGGNFSMFDLLDDINNALSLAGASSYVEAVLFDASALGRVVTRDDIGELGYEGTGRIGFRTISDTDWLLQVDVSTSNNAYSVLGFAEHESKSPALATLFIDNATVGATVGLQGTFNATASLGIVSLELSNATVDISGSAFKRTCESRRRRDANRDHGSPAVRQSMGRHGQPEFYRLGQYGFRQSQRAGPERRGSGRFAGNSADCQRHHRPAKHYRSVY